MDAHTIRIAVEADGAAGVGQQLGVVALAAQNMGTSVERSFSRVSQAFRGLNTGVALLGGLGLALGAFTLALGATIGPSIEFESAFAGVLKTVDGTPAQLQEIRQGLLDLSTVMPTTAVELAGIAENAGQLGVAADDVLEFTEVVARLGETTDLDFNEAAQSLARFLNVTGNQATITQLGDVIVELGNNSATTESQIVTFATRLSSAFTVAGAREDEILALAASFSSLGVEAEAGASALSTVITKLVDAAKLGGAELLIFSETAGLLPEQFRRIALTNPVEALLRFGEGLAAVADEGGSITPILEDLGLQGLRTTRVLQLMALAGDDIRDSLALAAAQFLEGGAAAEEYGRRTETTASRLEKLQNRIQTLAIVAGTPALDGLAIGADVAGDAIEALARTLAPLASALVDVGAQGVPIIETLFEALSGPTAQASVGTLGSLVGIIADVVAAFASLGPAGLVIAALAADIALVGPVSVTAASALAAIARNGGGAVGIMTSLQTASSGLLASLNPTALALAALGAAFVFFRSEAAEAERAAAEFAATFRTELASAVDSGDALAAINTIRDVRTEIADLERQANNVDIFGKINEELSDLTFGFLAGNDEIDNFERRIDELNGVLDGDEIINFERNVERLTEQFGLTDAQLVNVLSSQGALNSLYGAGLADLEILNAAIVQYQAGLEGLSAAQRSAVDEVLSGSATIEDFATIVGVTGEQFVFLADRIDSVDVAGLFDEDAEVRLATMNAVATEIEQTYGRLAASIGLTTTEYVGQLQAIDDLVSANSELEQAISGVSNAMDEINAAQERLTAAQNAYNESLDAFEGEATEENLRAISEAASDLVLALAGGGATFDEVTAAQERFGAQIVELGTELGLTRAELVEYVAEITGIPEAAITEIIALAEEAQANVEGFRESAEALIDKEYPVVITGDGSQFETTVGDMEALVSGFVTSGWVAPIEGDNSDLIAETEAAEAFVSSFVTSGWVAPIEGDNSDAMAETDEARANAEDWRSGDYEGQITADNSDAVNATNVAESLAESFARTYQAVLSAIDNASGVINAAKASLGGFRSKTITLTTINRSIIGGVQRADGGIDLPSGVSAFAGGGLVGLPPGTVMERPGQASIYAPATPGRFFAEPETGGEAWIPLAAAKRDRSVQIWQETGRLLGVLADGAIMSQHRNGAVVTSSPRGDGFNSTFAPNVSVIVNASGSGMDERRVGQIAADAVKEQLRKLDRELSNARSRR